MAFIFIILTACSKNDATPNQRLALYLDEWQQQNWQVMYEDFISAETKELYGQEQIIERTEKYVEDLQLDLQSVEIHQTDTEFTKDETAYVTATMHFNTVAGELEYEKDFALVFEEQNEEKSWFLEWDPSFILPDLELEDKVGVRKVPSKRGEIFDRNEKGLALNGTGAEVGVVSGQFDAAGNGQYLANILGIKKEYIDQQLSQSWVQEGHFVPLKKIPFTQDELYNQAMQVPGVAAQKVELREYPYNLAFAHLIGYTGQINGEELEKMKDDGYTESSIIGKRGLEQLLESSLKGTDGLEIYIEKTNQNGEQITVVEQPAVDGESVYLTVDAELQDLVYKSMEEEPGMATVIDPKTGETLALASSPAFDPNEWAIGISGSRYDALANDPKQPLLNRFASSYAPGSSIKTITAAIGLEAGTLKPEQTYNFSGKTWQQNASWGNYKVTRVYETPNPVNLEKGLIYSDNIYFANEALNLGKDGLIKGFEKFGYGEELPFKYSLRTSQISNDGALKSDGQLIDTSFGQGEMLVNIVHLASMYSPIIEDGKMMKPILFADEEKGQVWKEDLLSAEHQTLLQQYLRAVIEQGFAQSANIEEVKISGKTGTAELKSGGETRGQENGFFVAYPTDAKDYIIAMMIEGVESHGGSDHVAKKVANVMKNK